MGEAMGQRAGLARAGAGDDQQRPVEGLGRRALVGVEPGEEARRLAARRRGDEAQRGRAA